MKKLFSLLALMIATVAVVATGYTLTRPAKASGSVHEGKAVSTFNNGSSTEYSNKSVNITDEAGGTKQFEIIDVELTASTSHFDIGSFYVSGVTLTENEDGSQSFSYTGTATVLEPNSKIFTVTEGTESTTTNVTLTGTISKDGKLSLALTYKYALSMTCTYTFEEETTSGGSETGETTSGAGTYTDKASSTWNGSNTASMTEKSVTVTANSDGSYNFSVPAVEILVGTSNTQLASFAMENVSATANADGSISYEFSGNATTSDVLPGYGFSNGGTTAVTMEATSKEGKLYLVLNFKIFSYDCVYTFGEEITSGGSTIDPVDPDAGETVAGTAVVEDGYAPNGASFTSDAATIDWETQKLVASVDVSTCSSSTTYENILSVGDAIAEWNGVHFHFYYTRSSKSLQINYLDASGAVSRKDLTIDADEIVFEFSKENGLVINGEAANYGYNTTTTTAPSELYSQLFALSSIYVGGCQGSTFSNATYTYVRVQELETETPDTPTAVQYKADATMTYAENNFDLTDQVIEVTETAENTYTVVYKSFKAGNTAIGDLTAEGVTGETAADGTVTYNFDGKAKVSNIGDNASTLSMFYGISEGTEFAFKMEGTSKDGSLVAKFTATVFNQDAVILYNGYEETVTPTEPTVPATDKIYLINRNNTTDSYIYEDADGNLMANTANTDNMQYWQFESTGTEGRYYIKNVVSGNYIQSTNQAENTQIVVGTEPVEFEVKKPASGSLTDFYYLCSTDQTTIGTDGDTTLGLNFGQTNHNVVAYYIMNTRGNSYWALTETENTYTGKTTPDTPTDQSIEINTATGSLGTYNASLGNFASRWSSTQTEPQISLLITKADGKEANNVKVAGSNETTIQAYVGAGSDYTLSISDGWVITGYSFDFALITSGTSVTVTANGETKTATNDVQSVEVTGLEASSVVAFSLAGDNQGLNITNWKVTYKQKASEPVVEPVTYEADAQVSYNGSTVDVTDQTVEITETAENTYTVVIKGLTVGSNTLGDLTVEGVSGTLDEDGYINYSIENGTAVLSNVDTTTGLGFYGLIKEGQEFPFSMVGKSKDGSLVAKFTTAYSNEEVVIAYNGYTEETIDPAPEVEGEVVGTDGYEPNGATFTWETDINWENQKLVASIDVTGCSSAVHENLLSVGSAISQWDGYQNIHLYYTRSTQAAVLWYLNGSNSNRLQDEKSLTGDEVIIEISKENGIVINGESWNQAESDFATAYANFFALDHVQVGSCQGETQSYAKYNYVRVQDIEKDPETAINDFNAAVANGKADIYTINGVKVNALQKGINIVRVNGKTMKVVKK